MANNTVRRRTTRSTNTRRLTQEEQQIRLGHARSMVARLGRLLSVLVIIGLGAFVLKMLWDNVSSSQNLTLKKITILGNHTLSEEEILEKGQLKLGDPILKLDPKQITANLMDNPWVKDVNVRRQIPDRMVIEVIERRPVAVISLERLFLLDEGGLPFVEAPLYLLSGLPLITGLDRAFLNEYPEKAQDVLHWAWVALDLLSKDEFFGAMEVSEVYVSPKTGVDVELNSGELRLALGFNDSEHRNSYQEKLTWARQTLTVLEKRNKKARVLYLENNKQPQLVYAKLVE